MNGTWQYYGAAQPPAPKWYNPNRFNAADAAFAYAMSAIFLLVIQFAVVLGFSFLEDIPFAVDVVFTIISQSFMAGYALHLGKRKNVDVLRGGSYYFDGKGEHFLLVVTCFFIAITLFFPLTDFVENLVFTPEELNSVVPDEEGPLLYVFYLLTIFAPAIGEELLFRGVITHGLTEHGKGTAIVVSSALFTLMHTNPMQTVYQFLLGLFLGMIFVETKNILPCMLLHGLNNALSGIGTLVYEIKSPVFTVVYYAVTVVLGVLALISLLLAVRKKNKGERTGLVNAFFPPENPYQKEIQKQSGRYYYALKTAKDIGFTDETGEYPTLVSFAKKNEGKWFYTETLGWRPFAKKGERSSKIIWLCLGVGLNLVLWILNLVVIKGWLSL